MKQINEMDYLYASGRIRVLEGYLLNRERTHLMIEARTLEDAFGILTECGYDTLPLSTPSELEQLLSHERSRVFNMVAGIIPDPRIVDVFRIRYDTHNIKVLLKSTGTPGGSSGLLLDCGRVKTDRLTILLREMRLNELPVLMRRAVEEARDILARTQDPQLMDLALDKACLIEMLKLAHESGISFLIGYVRLVVDAANLRTLVRVKRMGKGLILSQHALSAGGSIPLKKLSSDTSDTVFENLYEGTLLKDAVIAGTTALHDDVPPTELDRYCDNALTAYLRPARMLAFGSPLVVAYLAAKESEITALRTILSGRLTGLPSDGIRERIRDHYV